MRLQQSAASPPLHTQKQGYAVTIRRYPPPKDRAKHHAQRYPWAHRKARARWKPLVEAGSVSCARCKQPIAPGAEWHLDHINGGLYPSHAYCNQANLET